MTASPASAARLSAVVVSALALSAAGCGKAHESAIGKGFRFVDAGGNDKKIISRQGDSTTVVVDARVDAYTRDANKIIAARRPLRVADTGAAAPGDAALQPLCEYWIIDVNTRVAHRIADAAEWPNVRCDGP